MRIVHVSDAYLPNQGGIEVQVHDLALRQVRDGHDVTVVTRVPAGAPGDAGAREPFPVHRIPTPWLHIPGSLRRLERIYAETDADVVHAHLSVLSPLSILAVRRAVRCGVPVVATLHSLLWYATPLYAIADLVIRWGGWPVHWTAVSDLAARPWRRIVRRRGEVGILPNGIDAASWRVDPLPRDPREVLVVSVMRLAPRKRPRALLRAIRRVLAGLPPGVSLRLVLVGDGPQRAQLERDITRLDLADHVELRGCQERDQIRDLYRRADLYVAPALLESFGIAALEARSAGVPVVARAGTGIADFIRPGEHGLLAPDDAGLAGAILALAVSPERRAEMSAAASRNLDEWSWPEVLHSCEVAYKAAAGLARSR